MMGGGRLRDPKRHWRHGRFASAPGERGSEWSSPIGKFSRAMYRPLSFALLAWGILTGAQAFAAREAASISGDIVVLRGLDRITARVTDMEIALGEVRRFGRLRIMPRVCYTRPPEEPPETTAFLEITELRPGLEQPTPLFTGWMFASSPALSALEHPVYDVWVIACKTSSPEAPSGKAKKSP